MRKIEDYVFVLATAQQNNLFVCVPTTVHRGRLQMQNIPESASWMIRSRGRHPAPSLAKIKAEH